MATLTTTTIFTGEVFNEAFDVKTFNDIETLQHIAPIYKDVYINDVCLQKGGDTKLGPFNHKEKLIAYLNNEIPKDVVEELFVFRDWEDGR